MPSRPRALKGTRHIVRGRVAFVTTLVILALALFASASSGPSTGYNSETRSVTTSTPMSDTTTATGSGSINSTVTTSAASSSAVRGLVYQVDNKTLDSLVNSTDAAFSRSIGAVPYYVVSEGARVAGLVYLTTDVAASESWGYHGPVGILAYVSTAGLIKGLWLWYSSEPRASDITPQYLASYTNHSVFDNLTVGSDALGVTGATFTAVAIASGVRDGGRIVVGDYAANYPSPTQTTALATTVTTAGVTTAANQGGPSLAAVLGSDQFRASGLIVAIFFAAVLAYEFNSDKLRYGVLGATVVLLGFYAGTMVSITDSVIFVSRDFPPLTEYFWYVLYAGALMTSLVWGRLYCGSVCPFGAFTQLLHRVSPFRLEVPNRVHRRLVYLKYVVLALVALAVAGGALWATGIEPFLTFFYLQGAGWTWVVLIVTVVLSVPFDRFYCSYVSPAGAGLAIAARLRIREINRWPECGICKVCERGCPSGAISGEKISASECMNCRTCEANYSNPDICPHYALQRTCGPVAGNGGGRAPGALVFSAENRAPA